MKQHNLFHKDKDNLLLLLLGVSSIFIVLLFFVFGPDSDMNFGNLSQKKQSQLSLAAEKERQAVRDEFIKSQNQKKDKAEEVANKTNFGKDTYKKDKYEISYVSVEKTYKIRIDAQTIDEFRSLKSQAETTLKEQIKVDNLCTIKANYIIPTKIKSQIKWEDLFITGCVPANS